MPGIDYSKWDNFNASSSSSDGDELEDEQQGGHSSTQRSGPEVTRLQYPTRVTLGPSGVQMTRAPSKATASPFQASPAAPSNPPSQSAPVGGSAASSTAAMEPEQHRGAAAENIVDDVDDDDEDLLYDSLARNGGREGQQHWWAQTEDTATVSFLVPWETTAQMVTQFCLREVRDKDDGGRYAAQLDIEILQKLSSPAPPTQHGSGNEEEGATVVVAAAPLRLCKRFRYPIKLSEDLVEGCWQLHRLPRRHLRLLVVEVFKEPIGIGMTLWWDRCFVTDTGALVDTQAIPDRVRRAAATESGESKAEQFRRVWNEAHEEFRRRMRERKQQSE